MHALLAALALVTADPAAREVPAKADRPTLLKKFRDEFIHITPGKGDFPASFQMGSDANASERPVRTVTFKHNFYIASYEVPQNLWGAVMGKNPSEWKGPRNSVERLSFDDAQAFCQRVTALLREEKLIGQGQTVRLPSEAEWEYTARAGTKTKYSFGDEVAQLDKYGWHTGNAAGNDPPVGAKLPNPWKLYDVHGYLWEFCADPWHDNYEGAPTDGSVWSAGGDAKKRVLRGGSWRDKADQLTSTARQAAPLEMIGPHIGLRCVLTE